MHFRAKCIEGREKGKTDLRSDFGIVPIHM